MGHEYGREIDPTAGMEVGGGAEERWQGGYRGPDPAPNPAGAIRTLTGKPHLLYFPYHLPLVLLFFSTPISYSPPSQRI
jgi:hypothetical protein